MVGKMKKVGNPAILGSGMTGLISALQLQTQLLPPTFTIPIYNGFSKEYG